MCCLTSVGYAPRVLVVALLGVGVILGCYFGVGFLLLEKLIRIKQNQTQLTPLCRIYAPYCYEAVSNDSSMTVAQGDVLTKYLTLPSFFLRFSENKEITQS